MNKQLIALFMMIICVTACDSRPINVHSHDNSLLPEFIFPNNTAIYTFEVTEINSDGNKIIWSIYSIKKSMDNINTKSIFYGVVPDFFAEHINPNGLLIGKEYHATATYADSTVHSCRFSFVNIDNVIVVKQLDRMAMGGKLKF